MRADDALAMMMGQYNVRGMKRVPTSKIESNAEMILLFFL